MKGKRLASVLDYLSGALRMVGVAAFMTSSLAIVFKKEEATQHPATVSSLLVIGLVLLILGAVLSFYSAKHDEE